MIDCLIIAINMLGNFVGTTTPKKSAVLIIPVYH